MDRRERTREARRGFAASPTVDVDGLVVLRAEEFAVGRLKGEARVAGSQAVEDGQEVGVQAEDGARHGDLVVGGSVAGVGDANAVVVRRRVAHQADLAAWRVRPGVGGGGGG